MAPLWSPAIDTDVAAADGEVIIALIPVAIDAPLHTLFQHPDLPVKQAEAVAARQLAARAIGPSVHTRWPACLRMHQTTPRCRVRRWTATACAQGLALLNARGLTPDYAIPAAIVARHIWWATDAEAVQRGCDGGGAMGIRVPPSFRRKTALTDLLTPGVAPLQASETMVAEAMAAAFANPCAQYADRILRPAPRSGKGMRRTEWTHIIFLLLIAALAVTMAMGVASWWRFAAAADAADARALAALSNALGPQNDVAAGESALDARLAREGRGAAVMSALLSALYQAMQGAPQVSVRQLRYTPDGTMMATLAAPTSDAANAVLLPYAAQWLHRHRHRPHR